ncbi:MAG TPA: hypothetical protein VE733_06520 [Streptosporangiaceae bacterium]|jgi:hypothetical protein|nr:hypothetical protein [Streptosporangiaceae bacterium]
MRSASGVLPFVALAAVLVLIPGPAVILIMQKAVTTGQSAPPIVVVPVLVMLLHTADRPLEPGLGTVTGTTIRSENF